MDAIHRIAVNWTTVKQMGSMTNNKVTVYSYIFMDLDFETETKLLIKTREKQLERLAVQLDGLNSLCQQVSDGLDNIQQI